MRPAQDKLLEKKRQLARRQEEAAKQRADDAIALEKAMAEWSVTITHGFAHF